MGCKPNPILCSAIDYTKFYIAECEAYWDVGPLTGCSGYYDKTLHDVAAGYDVKDWVCNNRDCTSGYVLIYMYGNSQRLVKLFGPWDTRAEAVANLW